MAGASRQKKLSKYVVTVRREVEYVTEVRVEARSAEEAAQIAETNVAESLGKPLGGTTLSLTARAKRIREGV